MQGDKLDIWFSQMDTENVKTSIRVDKHLFRSRAIISESMCFSRRSSVR